MAMSISTFFHQTALFLGVSGIKRSHNGSVIEIIESRRE
jgi:hypothetical protein